MPRDIPVGNGNLLLNFDSRYNLRDIYYPYVGQENQTVGDISHFGIWLEGTMAWSDSDIWDQRKMVYEAETLVTQVTLASSQLQLKLICRDVVDLARNVYIKKIELYDESGREREVRLFFHFDAHLMGNNVGDSAYFEPRYRAIIHYKNKRYFWLCGQSGNQIGLDEFSIGVKEVGGMEGTWRDAEDGRLGMNPVAQGSIDSTGMIKVQLPGNAEASAYFWLGAGENFDAVNETADLMARNSLERYISRTRNYWRLWVNKVVLEPDGLPVPLVNLYKNSLLILRTQIDNRGAIIAANDADIMLFGRDTYSYMWPRDGALVANALILAGYPDLAERFFNFCTEHLSKDGYLLHKYNPDGSIGSSWHAWTTSDYQLQLPIQEDETGLVLYALWQYYEKYRNLEYVQKIYRPLVLQAADFLASFRDERTKLPLPSHDLWEERRGILAFTVGAVWGGLMAAANFAEFFSEPEPALRYRQAATEIKQAAYQYLWDPERNRFSRMINFDKRHNLFRDSTIDSSLYGLFQFGMLSPTDPHVVATMEAVESRLWCKTEVGGVARYEDDYYYQISNDLQNVPGNPWFICTLWLAQWYIAKAKSREELGRARDLLNWVCDHALPSGSLAEQIHPYSNAPLSVSPLTWSHATYVTCIQEYLAKYRELDPSGLGGMI
ncbi:MAG: glycoside hydrolase family 15 protein [Chloroflexi bacterium]|nr:glycoside hydrolase family 15 protein [Chloroflexota bacterium]OJV97772.1 MAG: glycosyl hydrolase [Chloroflexi bacterium 54-19]